MINLISIMSLLQNDYSILKYRYFVNSCRTINKFNYFINPIILSNTKGVRKYNKIFKIRINIIIYIQFLKLIIILSIL